MISVFYFLFKKHLFSYPLEKYIQLLLSFKWLQVCITVPLLLTFYRKPLLWIIFLSYQIWKNKQFYFTFSIDKSKALSLVLHCADISHPAKDWNLHYRWTTSLLEEFFRQVTGLTTRKMLTFSNLLVGPILQVVIKRKVSPQG